MKVNSSTYVKNKEMEEIQFLHVTNKTSKHKKKLALYKNKKKLCLLFQIIYKCVMLDISIICTFRYKISF